MQLWVLVIFYSYIPITFRRPHVITQVKQVMEIGRAHACIPLLKEKKEKKKLNILDWHVWKIV